MRAVSVDPVSVDPVSVDPGPRASGLTIWMLLTAGRDPRVKDGYVGGIGEDASRVVVGALAGDDIGDNFVDRKDLSGPLLNVIVQIETFLQLYLRTAHEIVGFEKEKREEIPAAALREAVVNALVHRDYTIAGPTRVFVLSDRVEVRSPGRPPNSVDAEAMRAGVHVTRNPHIYSRVVEAELATRAGTGIRRIARLLRQANGTSLGIAISDAEVVLTLPRGPVT